MSTSLSRGPRFFFSNRKNGEDSGGPSTEWSARKQAMPRAAKFRLEVGRLRDARGEERGQPGHVVGNEISSVAVAAAAAQGKLGGERAEPAHQRPDGLVARSGPSRGFPAAGC